MSIHQVQLRYEPVADRLLLSVRTRQAELYRVWLTRRMVARLAGPLRQAVARLALPRRTDAPIAVPEAQQMLEDVARQRPLKDATFGQPFASGTEDSHPLGPEPLLPAEIDVRAPPGNGLQIVLREARGRRLELALGDDLATGLSRLLEQVLAQADWGLPPAVSAAEPPAAGPLN